MKVFCDTGFFVGYYNSADQCHSTAIQLLQTAKGVNFDLVTSDYIYDETLTRLLTSDRKVGYLRAFRFDNDIRMEGKITFLHVSDTLLSQAREIFFRYNKDKRWSFTDCTSFALMKDNGINAALTFDQNFSEMGFKMVEP